MHVTPEGFHLSLALEPGTYQYKFAVHDSPSQHKHRWCFDLAMPTTKDEAGNVNNWIRVDGLVELDFGINRQEKEQIPTSAGQPTASHPVTSPGHPAPSQQATQLDYWEDTYKFEAKAKVISVTDDKKGVILTSTIFYPQGGGQPSDVGVIKGSAGGVFNVTSLKAEKGVVSHLGNFQNENVFAPGEEVTLQIDESTRVLHARLHSAGHLLDVAVQNLGLTWIPAKGYHFPAGPYVEYQGDVQAEKRAEIVKQVQQQMNQLTSQ